MSIYYQRERFYTKMISDYEKSVNDLANKDASFQFENKGANHARIVVSAILNSSKNIVYMYSGSLSSDVTDDEDFLKTLDDFLDKEITFKLLLDDIPKESEQSEALKKVLDASTNAHVIVKKISKEAKKFLKDTEHFIVADQKAYRYETDAKEYKALCNFNDEELSKQLIELFTRAFDLCEYYIKPNA